MSLKRIQHRLSGVTHIGRYKLPGYKLQFHKAGDDGSAKCDAFKTNNSANHIYGALFKVPSEEIQKLDEIEGVGSGYIRTNVMIMDDVDGKLLEASTYIATKINNNLLPFSWYFNHVYQGAIENQLPEQYIQENILCVTSIEDVDQDRDRREREVYLNLL